MIGGGGGKSAVHDRKLTFDGHVRVRSREETVVAVYRRVQSASYVIPHFARGPSQPIVPYPLLDLSDRKPPRLLSRPVRRPLNVPPQRLAARGREGLLLPRRRASVDAVPPEEQVRDEREGLVPYNEELHQHGAVVDGVRDPPPKEGALD